MKSVFLKLLKVAAGSKFENPPFVKNYIARSVVHFENVIKMQMQK